MQLSSSRTNARGVILKSVPRQESLCQLNLRRMHPYGKHILQCGKAQAASAFASNRCCSAHKIFHKPIDAGMVFVYDSYNT